MGRRKEGEDLTTLKYQGREGASGVLRGCLGEVSLGGYILSERRAHRSLRKCYKAGKEGILEEPLGGGEEAHEESYGESLEIDTWKA